jgi:hypothetical protein
MWIQAEREFCINQINDISNLLWSQSDGALAQFTQAYGDQMTETRLDFSNMRIERNIDLYQLGRTRLQLCLDVRFKARYEYHTANVQTTDQALQLTDSACATNF